MEGGRVEGGSLVPPSTSTTPPKPEVSSPLPVAFAQPYTLTAQIFAHYQHQYLQRHTKSYSNSANICTNIHTCSTDNHVVVSLSLNPRN